jgi:hypothetical protein
MGRVRDRLVRWFHFLYLGLTFHIEALLNSRPDRRPPQLVQGSPRNDGNAL